MLLSCSFCRGAAMRSKCSALRGMDDKLKARKEENNCVCVKLFLITFLIGTVLIVMTLILPVPIFMFFHSISAILSLMSIILAVIFLLLPFVRLFYNSSIFLYSARKYFESGMNFSFNKSDHKDRNSTERCYLAVVSKNNLDKINFIALCLYRYGQNVEGFRGFCYSFCCQFAQDLVDSSHNIDAFISLLVNGVSIPLEHKNGRYTGDTHTIINRLNSVRVAAEKNILACPSVEGDGCCEKEGESCEGMECDENHYGYAGLIQLPCDYSAISQQKEGYSLCSSNNDYDAFSCEGAPNTLQVNG